MKEVVLAGLAASAPSTELGDGVGMNDVTVNSEAAWRFKRMKTWLQYFANGV